MVTSAHAVTESVYEALAQSTWVDGSTFGGKRIDLKIIRKGNLTAQSYADDILRCHVVLYTAAIGDSLLLTQDNARSYTLCLAKGFFEAATMQRMGSPACSLDLNSCMHVWNTLGRCDAARTEPPITVQDSANICTSTRKNSILDKSTRTREDIQDSSGRLEGPESNTESEHSGHPKDTGHFGDENDKVSLTTGFQLHKRANWPGIFTLRVQIFELGKETFLHSCLDCQVIYSQFGLAIHQNDHQARRRFVEWAQNEIAVGLDFHKRILFSDEAHFWLNGYVNKQNCRIWREAYPQVYVETPLHTEKLTVWCALWAGGIIGPYFFKNDEGHNVAINGDRYRAMITNFFIPELNNHDVQELWFQQDGATCHTARATIDLLKDTFGDRLISRFGPVNWPPRSCDLTPLDYFLWGYVKSLVYADKPQTLDHLEDNIHRVIADIRPQMLEKVIENWTSRLDYIRASRGSPMPEIIFKI
ncbi:DUF4817 domain-containing protein [Trichonephila clavipes]|uniref:DUF4817 domain-containing protein n=1 Tax=Trichonephila clavipes TaxID=2585209 RepID=A0A8X6S6X2_TRICX|nr:DUF4817 domain-containing protein [Trichonephila clavipes]